MIIAITSAALGVVLFLLWICIWHKKTYDELQEVYAVLARLADNQRIAQERHAKEIDMMSQEIQKYQGRTAESQQKLYDYMDLTRKESLDSYRRGLQDGISTSKQNPVYAPQNPVKTMEEHMEEKQENKEAKEANKAFSEGLSAIMNYTGDLPED